VLLAVFGELESENQGFELGGDQEFQFLTLELLEGGQDERHEEVLHKELSWGSRVFNGLVLRIFCHLRVVILKIRIIGVLSQDSVDYVVELLELATESAQDLFVAPFVAAVDIQKL